MGEYDKELKTITESLQRIEESLNALRDHSRSPTLFSKGKMIALAAFVLLAILLFFYYGRV
ncbi:MAG: hypothetical protein ACHQKY_09815 [Terriglobia bacterium]